MNTGKSVYSGSVKYRYYIILYSFDSESLSSVIAQFHRLLGLYRDTVNVIRGRGRVYAGWLLMVKATGARWWGRGVTRGLVLVFPQPLRTGTAKLLTQLK